MKHHNIQFYVYTSTVPWLEYVVVAGFGAKSNTFVWDEDTTVDVQLQGEAKKKKKVWSHTAKQLTLETYQHFVKTLTSEIR